MVLIEWLVKCLLMGVACCVGAALGLYLGFLMAVNGWFG
ncbi:hypothetical protein SEA_PHREDRICK_231 [Streptomyces phage Phredrick]|nr:hypothetical protein SEA_PHREDRICK_231 [Streptomyces phage Phredrick]